MSILRWLSIGSLIFVGTIAYGEGVPEDCTQLVVAVDPTWDSERDRLEFVQTATAALNARTDEAASVKASANPLEAWVFLASPGVLLDSIEVAAGYP